MAVTSLLWDTCVLYRRSGPLMTQSPRLRQRQMRAAIRRNPTATIANLVAIIEEQQGQIEQLVALLECDDVQRMN